MTSAAYNLRRLRARNKPSIPHARGDLKKPVRRRSTRLATKRENVVYSEDIKRRIKSEPVACDGCDGGEKTRRKRSGRRMSAVTPEQMEGRLTRALSQRLYLVSRIPSTPTHVRFLVCGSSGKLYTTSLGRTPAEKGGCNCVDHIIRKVCCKHILFLCARVFGQRGDSVWKGRVSEEEIRKFEERRGVEGVGEGMAPRRLREAVKREVGEVGGMEKVKRKKVEDGEECAICFECMKGDDEETLVWCEFGCGKSLHAECFERYEKAIQGEVKCVLCRAKWKGGEEVGKRGVLRNGRLVRMGDTMQDLWEEGTGTRGQEEEEWKEEDHEEAAEEDEEWGSGRGRRARRGKRVANGRVRKSGRKKQSRGRRR